MLYYSTSGNSPEVTLREAVMAGLAPDGGLYMPSRIPMIPKAFFNNMPDMSLPEIAYVVADCLFGDDVDSAILSRLAADVFDFEVPAVRLSPGMTAIELFHGPTGSFNDIGARFLAGLLPHLDIDPLRPVNFLMATAGDSGDAVARALHGASGANVTVLYPRHGLSRVQVAQLASLGDNVTAVEVNTDLAGCRAMVDSAFADAGLVRSARLTPASSINIARFLPQIFVYFHAYACVRAFGDTRQNVVIGVPCGNLGNLAAGLTAKRMGLPVDRFVATGSAWPDGGIPSNLPRIKSLYADSEADLAHDVTTMRYSTDEINRAATLCRSAGYLIENSSATAWQALNDTLDPSRETGAVLVVASPEKAFESLALTSDETLPEMSEHIADLLSRKQNIRRIGRHQGALRRLLLDIAAAG